MAHAKLFYFILSISSDSLLFFGYMILVILFVFRLKKSLNFFIYSLKVVNLFLTVLVHFQLSSFMITK